MSVLERFDRAALPALIGALSDERAQVREHAADILGLIGEPEAAPALAKVANDPNVQVRLSVVTALGIIGGNIARHTLKAMQEDSDQNVRQLASRMLERLR
nr:MAG: hypothetical protein DIU68_20220 [Chloroflexota bacterium]